MAVNLRFPLRKGTKGAFETNDTTLDAIKDDLRILLLTNYGERPVHYDFGANLRSLVFEQGPNITQQAEDLVIAAIQKWMPFVSLLEVRVENSITNKTIRDNEIEIHLRFVVEQVEGRLTQRIRG